MPPTETPQQTTTPATTTAPPWHVIILNDPVNLMDYVVSVLRKVFGYDTPTATRLMLEIHHQGRSKVWTGEHEMAEHYALTLQKWHLTAILEHDS